MYDLGISKYIIVNRQLELEKSVMELVILLSIKNIITIARILLKYNKSSSIVISCMP